jgi:starch-binding outer membrane protein, SusD/RagB family
MKRILSLSTIALLLFASSCKKIVEDVNINPNSPTDAPSNLLLNGAQVSSIVLYEGDWARLGGMWSQSFTGADRQYISLNNYVTTAGDYDNTWSTAYRGVIAPCKLIIEKETVTNNKIMIGIAQVMMAQAYGTLTSLFGDIPLTEAGDPAKFPAPKFDKQAAVYAAVQKLLDDAIVNLNSGVGVSPGTKDIFYGGSTTAWRRAAYTLKARYFLHVKDYANAITAAGNGISSAAGNMMAPHGEAYNSDFNLYYSFCVYDRDSYMGADDAIAPRLLDPAAVKYRGNAKTDEEARFNYLYVPDGGIGYHGVYELNILCDFDWGVATADNGFFGGNSSFPLVTFEENKLILAEAHIRNSNFSSALSALNDFRAYMSGGGYIGVGYTDFYGYQYDAYVDADFEAGGMENFGLSKNAALLKEILEERYVTLVGQIEQYNDVRRTKNAIGLVPTQGSAIPQRFFYPQSEINTNSNTPKQVAADLFKPTDVNL